MSKLLYFLFSAGVISLIQAVYYLSLPGEPTPVLSKKIQTYLVSNQRSQLPPFLHFISKAFVDDEKESGKVDLVLYAKARSSMIEFFKTRLDQDFRNPGIEIDSIKRTLPLKKIRLFSNHYVEESLTLLKRGQPLQAKLRFMVLYKFTQYLCNSTDHNGRNWDTINYMVGLAVKRQIFKLLLKGQEEGDFSQSEVRRVTNGLRQIRQMDLNQDEVFERGILYTNFLVGSSIANVYLEVERKEISGLRKKLIIRYVECAFKLTERYLKDFERFVRGKGMDQPEVYNLWLKENPMPAFNWQSVKLFSFLALGVTIYPPGLTNAIAEGLSITIIHVGVPNLGSILKNLKEVDDYLEKLA